MCCRVRSGHESTISPLHYTSGPSFAGHFLHRPKIYDISQGKDFSTCLEWKVGPVKSCHFESENRIDQNSRIIGECAAIDRLISFPFHFISWWTAFAQDMPIMNHGTTKRSSMVSSKNEDRCSIKLALFGTILSLRGFIYTSIDHFVEKNLCWFWIPTKSGQKPLLDFLWRFRYCDD